MSGVVSTRDYWVERHYGLAGLRARSLDRELEIRRNRIEELQAIRDKPEPVAVHPLLPTATFRKPARISTSTFGLTLRRTSIFASPAKRQTTSEPKSTNVAPHGLESGGYLYAHQPNRHSSTLVCLVTGPGPSSRHGRGSLQLSDPREVEAEFPDWLPAENFVRVGDFHSHPSGCPTPSRVDREAWAGTLRNRRHPTYASIIVTPSPGDAAAHSYTGGSRGWTRTERASSSSPHESKPDQEPKRCRD